MIADHARSSLTAELLSSLFRDGMDVRVRLRGWSMKPLVPSGSLVRFAPLRPIDTPAIGDVVLARMADDSLLAHRVVAIDAERIWTKGDACRTADGPLPRSSILARAVRREGVIPVPLSNAVMRMLGRVVNRFYPLVVAAVRGERAS